MAILYPLMLPTVKSFASIQLIPDTVVTRSESPFTLNQQVYSYGGERWRLVAKYPQLEPADYKIIKAFLLSLRGGWGTFYFTDPGSKLPSGDATGLPLVKGAAQIGSTLETDGWTPSMVGILKAGDDIQIGTHVYTVLRDADSDGSGNASLEIWPSLHLSPADDSPITTDNPAGLFRLEPGSVSFSEGNNKIYEVSFSAVEAI